MTRTRLAKERDVQKLITDWLSANRYFWMRMNTGAFTGEYNGKKRFVRFGKPGTPDLLVTGSDGCGMCEVFWIEVKAPKGKQSPEQKAFQAEVEAQGMKYILARSLDDVTAVLA